MINVKLILKNKIAINMDISNTVRHDYKHALTYFMERICWAQIL